jgi:hypothetical protein
MVARSPTSSNQRPDTLTQDRPPPTRRKPLATHGRTGEVSRRTQVFSELGTGLDLFLVIAVIDDDSAKRARRALKEALAALDARTAGDGPGVRKEGGPATDSGSS